MRDLRTACIVAACTLGFFVLVGAAYVVVNPEIIVTFVGAPDLKAPSVSP